MVTRNQMEIEAKIAVDDLEAIETRLRELGARAKGRFTETDVFFDDANRRLKKQDSALRLRDRRNLETGQSEYRLTYKGPRLPGPFKHRREIEFAVDRPENVKDLLGALGMKAFVGYGKNRNSWSLDGCDIEVDFVEGIGKFVEVEGPEEKCIREVLARLSLQDRPVIHESYLAMVLRKREVG
jgi:adenylate cyclase, class 2